MFNPSEVFMDWERLVVVFESNKSKDYFQAIIESSTDDALYQYLQVALDGIGNQHISAITKISIIKSMLSQFPSSIINQCKINFETVTMICQVAGDFSQNPSTRYQALATVSIIQKKFYNSNAKQNNPLLSQIGEAIAQNIKFAFIDLSQNTNKISPEEIILSQCAEILLGASDCAALWLRAIDKSVSDASSIINLCTEKRSQTQIAICKAYVVIVDVYMITNNMSFTDITLLELHKVPLSICHMVCNGQVVHECFQSALECSFQMLHATSSLDFTSISPCINLLYESILNIQISTSTDIARIENILGVLSCIFDFIHEHQESYKVDINSNLNLCQRAVDAIRHAMSIMKVCVKSTTTTQGEDKNNQEAKDQSSNASVELSRDIRIACGSCRKGCIATAQSIFQAFPQWISQYPTELFELSIKTLTTPVLFGCFYNAVGNTQPILLEKCFRNIVSGLDNIHRYPQDIATDIITTIEDLCKENCIEIISYPNFLRGILNSYNVMPKKSIQSKGNGKRNSKRSDEAEGDGDTANGTDNWKYSCVNCLIEVFKLCQKNVLGLPLEFICYVVNTLCEDMMMIEGCLGYHVTMSHGSHGRSNTGSNNGGHNSAVIMDPDKVEDRPVSDVKDASRREGVIREKARQEISQKVKARFGTTNPEELGVIVHAITSTLVLLLDIKHFSFHDCKSALNTLLSFLVFAVQRVVIFQDDGFQLCSDIELLSRLTCFVLQSNDTEICNVNENEIASFDLAKMECVRDSVKALVYVAVSVSCADFQLTGEIKDILSDLAYNEINNIHAMILPSSQLSITLRNLIGYMDRTKSLNYSFNYIWNNLKVDYDCKLVR